VQINPELVKGCGKSWSNCTSTSRKKRKKWTW